VRGRQSSDTATYDDDIDFLARIVRSTQHHVELLIANAAVRGIDYFVGIPIGASVIPDSTGARPIGTESGHLGGYGLRLCRPNRAG
jgi:hypothetical protein